MKLKKCKSERLISEKNLSKYLDNDQLEYIRGKKRVNWGVKSISKALFLRKKGKTTLDMVRTQIIPLPSLNTCNRRIKDIQFSPGILDFNLHLLEEKCKNLAPVQKNFTIGFDEIGIIPGYALDPSTKQHMGNVTLPEKENWANLSLVCVAMGFEPRVKQIVAYHFTDKTTTGDDMKEFIFLLIRRMESCCGIKVRAISFDLGTANRSLILKLGIKLNADNEIYYVDHPTREGEKVYLYADGTHASKNINQGIKNHGAKITREFRDDNNLSSLVCSFDEIKSVNTQDQKLSFPLAPKLKREVLFPTQFEKMDPKNAMNFHSAEVITSLDFKHKEKLNGKRLTTSFVLEQLNLLHSIITSNDGWRIDTQHNKEKYDTDIKFLKWMTNSFFKSITIGSARLVSIYGMRMSINTLINLSRDLLDEGIEEFKPSRLLTDAVENVFSTLRSLTPLPSAVQVSQSLRIMSISQMQFNPIDGVYSWDESDDSKFNFVEILQRCKPEKEKELEFAIVEYIVIAENIKWKELFVNKIDYNSFVCHVGTIIGQVIKKYDCSACKEWILEELNDEMSLIDGYELMALRYCFLDTHYHVPSLKIVQLCLNL